MAETQQVFSVMQIHGGVPRVLTVTTMVPAKACQMPYRPPDVHKPTYLQGMRCEAALRLVMLLMTCCNIGRKADVAKCEICES